MAPKFDVYAHVTDTIIAEIEAGTPPWRKPWTGSASGIALPTRHNGEEYRGINILMLWVMAAKNGFVSSRWMTYKQAQELGGQVLKGQTSSRFRIWRSVAAVLCPPRLPAFWEALPMARNSAVVAAQDAFFDRDWSRIRGSAPRQRQKQMARAAMGHSPAIFKGIRDGGTHSKAQLRNQLEYLTTKSSFIIDSRGTYDGQSVLSAKEIEQVTRRFSAQWNEGFHPKLGHTSHLLMAFPIGTRGADVAEITREICERFFQGEGSHFDYVAAVHEDRDHPHAHIVLNRRSKDGEFFFLKQGHHFNYDNFREAMVDVSDRYGLRLEATRKVERGITTTSASDAEYRRTTATGQALSERERVGPELDDALAEVAQNARLYRGLAAEATRENQLDIAAALDKAATLLAQGKPIEADGKVYGMAEEQHSFDEVVDAFHDKIGQAERVVAKAPVERRAELEHELNDIYRSLSHLSPIGTQLLAPDGSPSSVISERDMPTTVENTPAITRG